VTPQQSLDKIVQTLEDSVARFEKSASGIEKQVYEKVVDLTKELKISGGKISMTGENIRMISSLKSEIEKIILSPKYKSNVKEFLKTFSTVETLQNSYFSSMVENFSAPKVLKAVKQDAIRQTASDLTESGVDTNITTPIQKMIQRSITEGGSYASLLDGLKSQIVSTTDNPGLVSKHLKTYTVTSINTFSANYNETISQDLGFKWRMYTGSLLETSRPWCVHMAKKKYVHQSELRTVIFDNIDGVKICSSDIPCNKKTGLPSGMIDKTDETNIGQRRGGWNCGHQFGGVPDAVVPKNLRDQIAGNPPAPTPPPKPPIQPPKPPEPPKPDPQPAQEEKKFTQAKFYSKHPQQINDDLQSVTNNADGATDIANEFKTTVSIVRPTDAANLNGIVKFSSEVGAPIRSIPQMDSNTDGACFIDNRGVSVKVKTGDTIEFKSNEKLFNLTDSEDLLKEFPKYREAISRRHGRVIADEKGVVIAKIDDTGMVKQWSVGILNPTNKAPVVSHEMGHLIHNKYDPIPHKDAPRKKMEALAQKLKVTLDDAPTIYGQFNWSEFWSESFSSYIYNRSGFKKLYPKAFELFESAAKEYGIDLKTIKEAK